MEVTNSNAAVAAQPKSLWQKLLTIQRGVSGLSKDTEAFGYKYVSGSKLLKELRPLMDAEGVILKQEVEHVNTQRIDYKSNRGAEKSELLCEVTMKFTWVNVDDPTDVDVNMFYACGMNEWEKGFGSALTYAERYFLMKYFHIQTDEDDIDNPARKAKEREREEATARRVEQLCAQVLSASSTSTLENIWRSNSDLHTDNAFKAAVIKRKEQLSK